MFAKQVAGTILLTKNYHSVICNVHNLSNEILGFHKMQLVAIDKNVEAMIKKNGPVYCINI